MGPPPTPRGQANKSNGTDGLAVFDLDGTLIDSRRDLATAPMTCSPLTERRAARRRRRREHGGCGAATLVKRCWPRRGSTLRRQRLSTGFWPCMRPIDAAYAALRLYPRLLDELHAGDVRLALLTHKRSRIGENFSRSSTCPLISSRFSRRRSVAAEAGARRLWSLMQHASAAPDETVLIGDSAVDLQSPGTRVWRSASRDTDLDCRSCRGCLAGDESVVDTPREIADVVYARR